MEVLDPRNPSELGVTPGGSALLIGQSRGGSKPSIAVALMPKRATGLSAPGDPFPIARDNQPLDRSRRANSKLASLRQIGPGTNGSLKEWLWNSVSDSLHQGIEISPLNRWERFRYVGEVPDQRFLFRRNRPQRPARTWRASPSFAIVHPSSPINGTKRTSATWSGETGSRRTRTTGGRRGTPAWT